VKHEMIILFDLDGTLIDSTEAILESFHAAYEGVGESAPPAANIIKQIGHPLDVMFLEFGVSQQSVWEYVKRYKAHYRQISRAKTTLLPDAKKAVEEAAGFARLGVVTTKTREYSLELLEHMGLLHYFEVVIGREDVEHPKPHPEPILSALSKLQVTKSKCWMIGDTCLDMISANEAGIGRVAVLCGYGSRDELSDCGAFVAENALEAVKFINNA